MARLVGLMAVTVWLSAATVDGRNGATAEITQLQDLRQNAGALLFEAGEGIGQKAPPIRTYLYVRIIDSKKETRQLLPCRSRTPPLTAIRLQLIILAIGEPALKVSALLLS